MKAAEIVALRERLGLTQVKFAAVVGCHPQTISGWECGSKSPRGLYLAKLEELRDQERAL